MRLLPFTEGRWTRGVSLSLSLGLSKAEEGILKAKVGRVAGCEQGVGVIGFKHVR